MAALRQAQGTRATRALLLLLLLRLVMVARKRFQLCLLTWQQLPLRLLLLEHPCRLQREVRARRRSGGHATAPKVGGYG